ncbi:MAG: D-sedoheptulose 7-phosphate isomerase [Arenicella sp.]|jgi:D-sedoheptulose 7-phosphate isomerase
MKEINNKKHLKELYPFLHSKKQDPVSMNKALLDSITHKYDHHLSVIESFVSNNSQAIIDVAHTIAKVYLNKGQMFTMGCGGSSSDASHIAVEFLHPVTTGRPALPAYDLTSDKTLITAISNDVGFEHAYMRQVNALVKPGDVLIGVSTSGNSQSLIKAFKEAHKKGAATVALLGGGGGETLNSGLDHCLVVESDSIHRIQECHVFIYHVLWDLVHTLLADQRGDLEKMEQAEKIA